MHRNAYFAVVLVLAGCAPIDKATSTTFEQRCAGYKVTYAAIRAFPPSESREKRLRSYEALLDACPP